MDEPEDKFKIRHIDFATREVHGVRTVNGVETEGVIAPLNEGEPIQEGEEIVSMRASSTPGVVGVRSVYKHSGPARVATKKYRANYDTIFGAKKAKDLN